MAKTAEPRRDAPTRLTRTSAEEFRQMLQWLADPEELEELVDASFYDRDDNGDARELLLDTFRLFRDGAMTHQGLEQRMSRN